MAASDDLDDFFKKKDRKGNKHKKQTGLLTNNEELLKQLVIVTSATSAFKENIDLDEEDEDIGINNQVRHQLVDEPNGIIGIHDENNTVANKSRPNITAVNNKHKNSAKLTVQDNHANSNEQQTNNGQQDEWEEFENSNPKYDQLRLKISRGANDHNTWDDDEDEDYHEDGHHTNNHDGNTDDNTNYTNGDNDEQYSRGNRRREQAKEKPAWKLDQIKQTETIQANDSVDSPTNTGTEIPSKSTPTTGSDVYRPPQLRNSSSVTVVRSNNQRTTKREKPNLASTDEFPTLGAAVNKK